MGVKEKLCFSKPEMINFCLGSDWDSHVVQWLKKLPLSAGDTADMGSILCWEDSLE